MVVRQTQSKCLQQLQILGTLMIVPDDTNPNIVFRANIIFGRGGTLMVGSAGAPLDPKYSVTFELCGNSLSPYLTIDPTIDNINKGFMVTNGIQLWGSPRTQYIARLKNTALANSPTITTNICLTVNAGDEIAVGPSDYGNSNVELTDFTNTNTNSNTGAVDKVIQS